MSENFAKFAHSPIKLNGKIVMPNDNVLDISSNDSIQQELKKLRAILSERLTFDPFRFDDNTLWDIVSKRENNTLHPYHFMIVRFGELFDIEAKPPYSAYKRIPIFYTNKRGSKNLKDFSFPIIYGEDNKVYNIIHNPNRRWDNITILNLINTEENFM